MERVIGKINRSNKAKLLFGALFAVMVVVAIPIAARAAVTASIIGIDKTTGSTSETAPGNTVRWVTTYNHTGSLGTLQFDHAIPAGSQYVPGSFVSPPDFVQMFSADGGNSYGTSDSGANTTDLRANGPAPGTSTARAEGLVVPPESFDVGNETGDGMEVFFIDDRVYNVNHHRGVGPDALAMVQCHIKTTGEACAGFPTYASSTAGATLGTGVDDMITPNQNWGAIDQDGKRIFVPAGRVDTPEIGVLCIDLSEASDTFPGRSCGFTHLGDSTNNNLSQPGGGGVGEVSGGAQIGSQFYIIGNDSHVYCYDMATGTVCGGWPAGGLVSDPAHPLSPGQNQVSESVIQAYDNRYVFGTYNRGGGELSIICIDTSTNSLCNNYPVSTTGGQSKVAPLLDATGENVTGICMVDSTDTMVASWNCYDVADGANDLGVAPWQATQPAGQPGSFGYYSTINIGPKLYMFNSPDNTTAAYSCWDFSIGADCDGFVRNTPDQDSAPYSLREDPFVPGCIWMIGDLGVFEQFDAVTGGSQCSRAAASVSAEPAAYYCDGQGSHFTNWGALSIHNIDGNSQYSGGLLTIRDQDGAILPGYDGRDLTAGEVVAGSVDLSSIPISGSTASLEVHLTLIDADRNAWTDDGNDLNDPYIQLSWQGDGIQFCFETVIQTCTSNYTLLAAVRLSTIDDENPSGQTDTVNANLNVTCAPGETLASTGTNSGAALLAAAAAICASLAMLAIARRRVGAV